MFLKEAAISESNLCEEKVNLAKRLVATLSSEQ
eukprot:COSAG06_NODE_62495_length_265_cov_0.530120_2_plen_32_part_01